MIKILRAKPNHHQCASQPAKRHHSWLSDCCWGNIRTPAWPKPQVAEKEPALWSSALWLEKPPFLADVPNSNLHFWWGCPVVHFPEECSWWDCYISKTRWDSATQDMFFKYTVMYCKVTQWHKETLNCCTVFFSTQKTWLRFDKQSVHKHPKPGRIFVCSLPK